MPALLATLTTPLPPSAVDRERGRLRAGRDVERGDAGLAAPPAQAVTVVAAVAQLAEMFSATAPTPLGGHLADAGHAQVEPLAAGPSGRLPSARVS